MSILIVRIVPSVAGALLGAGVEWAFTGCITGGASIVAAVGGAFLKELWRWVQDLLTQTAYDRGKKQFQNDEKQRFDKLEKTMSRYRFLGKAEYKHSDERQKRHMVFPVRIPKARCRAFWITVIIWLYRRNWLSYSTAKQLLNEIGVRMRDQREEDNSPEGENTTE